MRLRLLALTMALGVLASCATPINPALWNPLPQTITVVEDLVFESRGVGTVALPAGEYHHWYSNKFGHYYRNDKATIRQSYKTITGSHREESYKGGLWLSNRVDAISVYELSSVENDRKRVGEVATLAAWESGDSDGLSRNWKASFPDFLRAKLRFR